MCAFYPLYIQFSVPSLPPLFHRPWYVASTGLSSLCSTSWLHPPVSAVDSAHPKCPVVSVVMLQVLLASGHCIRHAYAADSELSFSITQHHRNTPRSCL